VHWAFFVCFANNFAAFAVKKIIQKPQRKRRKYIAKIAKGISDTFLNNFSE